MPNANLLQTRNVEKEDRTVDLVEKCDECDDGHWDCNKCDGKGFVITQYGTEYMIKTAYEAEKNVLEEIRIRL